MYWFYSILYSESQRNHFYKTLIINKTISVFLLKQNAIRLKKTRKCSLLSDLPCRNLV